MGKGTLHIAPDHPTASGHFPGNPIIPGALLLAEVVHLIGTQLGQCLGPCAVKNAKFFHPARPGDTLEVEFSLSPRGDVSFQCNVGETKVLAGTMNAPVSA